MAKANMKDNENVNENVNMNGNENVNETGKNTNPGDEKPKETTTAKKVEKVKVTIPKDPVNKNDSFVPVSINGYIYQIKRGEEVAVPKEVARILKEAGYIS